MDYVGHEDRGEAELPNWKALAPSWEGKIEEAEAAPDD